MKMTGGKAKKSEESLSQCHFAHQKSHTDYQISLSSKFTTISLH